MRFSHDQSGVPARAIERAARMLEAEHGRILDVMRSASYDDPRSSVLLPDDAALLRRVRAAVRTQFKRGVDHLVVVGIGGSNLGAWAVLDAVRGRLWNSLPDSSPKVWWLDTVDPGQAFDIVSILKAALERGERVLVNVISKSGTTTETVANLGALSSLLSHKLVSVVVTSDRESPLWKVAGTRGWDALEIPARVGGRYSVFSPVGLFPLGIAGLDVDALLGGARVLLRLCTRKAVLDNPALVSASLAVHHPGKPVHDAFFFDTDFEMLGKWWRQLAAESIGKKGKGFTPTVSIGTTDLHSMGQLYLGGPRERFTTFVAVKYDRESVRVQSSLGISSSIEGRSFADVRNAILRGVMSSYRQRGLPFASVELERHSEHEVGQFLQWKMLETMYLGALFGVNAFDQPDVESYKEQARRMLLGALK